MRADAKFDVVSETLAAAKELQIPTWFAAETSSTNSIAKDDQGPLRPRLTPGASARDEKVIGPSLYLTASQTQGRGRGTHTWSTPDSGCLLSSWAFAVPRVPQPIFSAAVGLAVYEAVAKTWPQLPLGIKAPNDLFIDDKKAAGILIESVEQGADKLTVIGIGLNVFRKPSELSTAASLSDHHPELSASEWKCFLSFLRTGLSEAVESGQRDELSVDQCSRLLEALKKYPLPQPLLGEPLLSVDRKGQLRSANHLVRWQDL